MDWDISGHNVETPRELCIGGIGVLGRAADGYMNEGASRHCCASVSLFSNTSDSRICKRDVS